MNTRSRSHCQCFGSFSAFVVAAAAFAILTQTSRADASATFVPVVADVLALKSVPECTLCHTTLAGGFGTAVTPVGTYLRSRGAKAANVESLRAALAAMIAEKRDSDGDGVADVDELRARADPNSSGGSAFGEPPAFGCGARVAAGRGTNGALAVVVGIVGALALLRRKRAERR
jgi:hypothetical protein